MNNAYCLIALSGTKEGKDYNPIGLFDGNGLINWNPYLLFFDGDKNKYVPVEQKLLNSLKKNKWYHAVSIGYSWSPMADKFFEGLINDTLTDEEYADVVVEYYFMPTKLNKVIE